MTTKPNSTFPIAPLQRVKGRRVTDPAELAKFKEERRKAREQAVLEAAERAVRTPEGILPPGAEASPEFRLSLDDLSTKELLTLGQLVIGRLPPAELAQLHQHLHKELGEP